MDDIEERRKELFKKARQTLAENKDSPPAPPKFARKAWNFVNAVAKHIQDGGNKATQEIYKARLAICNECPSNMRDGDHCNHHNCGCVLSIKARWASEKCPVGYWKAIKYDENFQPYEVE